MDLGLTPPSPARHGPQLHFNKLLHLQGPRRSEAVIITHLPTGRHSLGVSLESLWQGQKGPRSLVQS